MLRKGDKVRQVSGYQIGTEVGKVYEVVAGNGDAQLTISGREVGKVCTDGEFYIRDDDGDFRYQCFPHDACTGWELVA